MKIVIVGTAYPLRGGIAHYNALLAYHLGKRHSVETITFKRQYPALLFPGKTQSEGSGNDALPIPINPAPQLVDSINPINWIRVGNLIRQKKPDLVIFKYWLPFFGPCFGTIAKIAGRSSNTKILFICDNIIPHERRPGDIVFTRYAFRHADCFIVQSNAVERDLNAFVPAANYKNVPHPVYEMFGNAIPKSDARKSLGMTAGKILLFFGYVRAYKGLMVLLEGMSRLKASYPDVYKGLALLVVGEFYDNEARYRERVKELGIEDSVKFVSDYVANDKVSDYFSAADAVVLPYLSATQSGITQIAYNFDRPVIATKVGGLAEVVLDGVTGYIVPPNDPETLARAIAEFYGRDKEAAMSANVRLEKRKYSWDYLVSSIEELTTKAGREEK